MRFGTWRALPLALSAGCPRFGPGIGNTGPGWPFHTIPRVSPAYDYTTGGEFMAPPVPYGHYAKDYVGAAHKHAAVLKGHLLRIVRRSRLVQSRRRQWRRRWLRWARLRIGPRRLRPQRRLGLRRPGCFGGISCGILGHHKHGGGSADCNAARQAMRPPSSGPSAQSRPDPVRPDGLRAGRLQRSAASTRTFGGHSGFRPLRRPGLRHRLRSRPRKRKWNRRRTGRLRVLRRQGLQALPRQGRRTRLDGARKARVAGSRASSTQDEMVRRRRRTGSA